ncbi:MAG: peptidyl-prolyl cis-trans isomerase, partial [Stellaceae bacterium]
QQGQFDRNIYEQVLAQNNLTGAQFETMQRNDLLRAQLTSAVGSGITPPKELVDTLYRSRAERRVAQLVTVPASIAVDPGQPSAQQLDAFWKSHPELFQAPERRSFTVASLRPEDVAKDVKVTDEQLKQHYDQYPDEFRTPEERQVQQMLLPDEATAKTAEDALRQGKTFDTVAKQVAKMSDPASLDLGLVKRKDLPPELASAAFSLKAGEVSQPIKSAFGWHILRVSKIQAASGQTFDQVKDKLRQQLAKDAAANKVADLANNIDDAVAGGANFDEVVKKFGLKTTTATQVGSDGKDAKGTALDLGDDHDAILKTAFGTQAGQMSPLQDDGHNGYYIVKVDKVTPAETQPLAQVHDPAVTDWQAAQRKDELQKIADGLAHQVNAGQSLKDAAAARKLTATTSPVLQRTSGDASVPPSLVAQIFSAKKGAAVSEAVPDGIIVAQVQSIEPADPKADPTAVTQLSDELAQTMQGDVLTEYD